MLPRRVLTFALAALLPSVAARAQAPAPAEAPPQFDAPAYVAVVDGGATLERDGRVEISPLNMPLLAGDKLRTADGRVEVRFSGGGRLLLDSRTSVDFLSDDLVRLGDGRLRLTVTRAAAQPVAYRVDSPAGTARILQPGDYRIALLHGAATAPGVDGPQTQIEFAVMTGGGELVTDQGATPVRAGERAYASAGLLPSYAYAFNSASGDDFDRWADMQRDTVYAATSPSAQYLPPDMTSYSSTFDQYGDWQYQQQYGYVWYPRVAADWRPYSSGSWSSYPSYGWTWIPSDPFGYPTHHYGRWGVSANAWFWIPSAAWGPAYVSWAYAPDYVSWCPLGYGNTAVFSVGYYNSGPYAYSSHDHGHYSSGWTTVPHGYFGHGSVHAHAVNWDRNNNGSRPHFTEGHAPAAASYAVARSTGTPIRFAGTRTAPAAASAQRSAGQTPRYINRGNEIVRSQTERPSPPRQTGGAQRDIAAPRTAPSAPQGAYGQRPVRAWDNPQYRPPNYNPAPSATAPAYAAPQSRGYEQRAVPGSSNGGDAGQPQQPRPYEPAYRRPAGGGYQPPPAAGPSRPDGGSARPAPPSNGGGRPARGAAPSGGGHESHAAPGAGVPARSSGRGGR